MMMSKRIKYLLILCCFSTSLVFSQDKTISKKLGEVIVSENRASSSENITNVFVISAKEIKDAPVQTIEDLLEYAINVDVRQRSGQGVQSDVSIRGGSFEQVLIMLNGIKFNDPQTGHHNMNIPISIEQIKRIEVLTGGASRVFGNYAYTGAINIITKRKTKSSLIVSGGENNFQFGELNYSKKINSIYNNLSISSKSSDGYIKGMDYKINNLYYQANTQLNSVFALFNFGIIDKEFGAYNFYTPAYPDQFEKTKTTFASLQFKRSGKISLHNKFYWRMHNDDFTLFRDNPQWYQNFHQTNVYAMESNAIHKTKNGSNVIGMEIRTDQILSNVLGEDLENPIAVDNDSNYYYKGKSETTTSLFIEKNINFDKVSISTGVMLNINSVYGNNYFPGIDISYSLSDNIKVFSSYNESMRAPNYTERYYSSPTYEGNKYLKSEYSKNMEFGISFKNDFHTSSFTLYKREGQDMIDWILLDGDSLWRTANLSVVNCSGYELSSNIKLNKILGPKFPFSRLSLNYSFNDLDSSSIGFQSAYVLDNIREKLSLSTTQKIGKRTVINWRANMQDREGSYIDFVSQEEIDYASFWLFSARISHTFAKKTIFAEINNISDNNYVDYGNVPQPGRWMRLGLKLPL